jgi:glycosyltransferase involved in cell wall biosynthesis
MDNLKTTLTHHPADQEKKAICFVINVSWFFLSHRLPIALEALRRGYSVHVATNVVTSHDRQALLAYGIQVHDMAIVRGSLAIIKDFRMLFSLWRLFIGLKPTIVHTVTLKPVIFGGLAARLARVPILVAAISGLGYTFATSSPGSSWRRLLLLRTLRSALRHPNSRVIFQNREDRQILVSAGAVAERQAVVIGGSGVELERYPETPEPAGTVRVLFASRMLREKGVEDFVRAAASLRTMVPDAKFILAGGTDEENPGSIDRGILEQWHDSGVIEWLGHCSDMPQLLAGVNIVCLPSYYGEGVPKVLLEAAAAGRPIVTTNTPGCREVVEDGVNGFLVPPRDHSSLVSALSKLIRDRQLREAFGKASRSRAVAKFNVADVVANTMGIYDQLLARCKLIADL